MAVERSGGASPQRASAAARPAGACATASVPGGWVAAPIGCGERCGTPGRLGERDRAPVRPVLTDPAGWGG